MYTNFLNFFTVKFKILRSCTKTEYQNLDSVTAFTVMLLSTIVFIRCCMPIIEISTVNLSPDPSTQKSNEYVRTFTNIKNAVIFAHIYEY